MKLATYLSENGITREEFAKSIGVSGVAVTRYVNGDRFPQPAMLTRILEQTKGAVTPTDFLAGVNDGGVKQ